MQIRHSGLKQTGRLFSVIEREDEGFCQECERKIEQEKDKQA